MGWWSVLGILKIKERKSGLAKNKSKTGRKMRKNLKAPTIDIEFAGASRSEEVRCQIKLNGGATAKFQRTPLYASEVIGDSHTTHGAVGLPKYINFYYATEVVLFLDFLSA